MPKPALAINWLPDKLKFPLFAQPKIDGVRGLHLGQSFTGRSLKIFKNRSIDKFWSSKFYHGLDGELVLPGVPWTEPGQCRLTTGLTNRHLDPMVPDLVAFDYLAPEFLDLPYYKRYEALRRFVLRAQEPKLHLIPNHEVRDYEALLELDTQWLSEGYEGTIIRLPGSRFKEGRATSRGIELWRIKRFIDFEVKIVAVYEAMENRNVAKVNALGRTERSSHKANKVGKGMIGMLQGEILQDVIYDGEVLFPAGMVMDIGPGEMPHIDRLKYWVRKDLILGKIATVKTFPRGVLDKPRMPTFKHLRGEEDMS